LEDKGIRIYSTKSEAFRKKCFNNLHMERREEGEGTEGEDQGKRNRTGLGRKSVKSYILHFLKERDTRDESKRGSKQKVALWFRKETLGPEREVFEKKGRSRSGAVEVKPAADRQSASLLVTGIRVHRFAPVSGQPADVEIRREKTDTTKRGVLHTLTSDGG